MEELKFTGQTILVAEDDDTREIRKFRPELPVILLTAHVSQDSIRDAVMSGCNDYLAKPIGPEELLTVLKKWLVR